MSETTFQQPPRQSGQIAGVDTKWWIIGGGAAVIIVYWAYKRSKNTAVPATDPNATDPIDPSTGIPYSQEGSQYGTTGYSPVYGGAAPTPVQTATTINVREAAPATNAEWYFKAVTALEKHHVPATHARRVLAEYLSRLPLTEDDIAIVEQAVRLIGPPPQPVPIHRVATPSRHRKH